MFLDCGQCWSSCLPGPQNTVTPLCPVWTRAAFSLWPAAPQGTRSSCSAFLSLHKIAIISLKRVNGNWRQLADSSFKGRARWWICSFSVAWRCWGSTRGLWQNGGLGLQLWACPSKTLCVPTTGTKDSGKTVYLLKLKQMPKWMDSTVHWKGDGKTEEKSLQPDFLKNKKTTFSLHG